MLYDIIGRGGGDVVEGGEGNVVGGGGVVHSTYTPNTYMTHTYITRKMVHITG